MLELRAETIFPGIVSGKVLKDPTSHRDWRDKILVLTGQNWKLLVYAQDVRPAGIVIAEGPRFSHAAIFLASLRIPSVSVSSEILSITNGTEIIVNATVGTLVIEPEQAQKNVAQLRGADNISPLPPNTRISNSAPEATSRDGQQIRIGASINGAHGAFEAVRSGASEIGLLRTEFLPGIVHSPESAEAHYNSLREILLTCNHLHVTIRLLDFGAEKSFRWAPPIPGGESALGLRGLRLFCHDKFRNIVEAQLVAINALAREFNISLLVPFVTHPNEIATFTETYRHELGALKEHLGTMIEVPALCYQIHELGRMVHFGAVGLNDLSQLIFAADRTNPHVGDLLNPLSAGLHRFVYEALTQSRQVNFPLRVCGQMLLHPYSLALLLGMGFRQFSLDPAAIPVAKKLITQTDLNELSNITREFLVHPDKIAILLERLDDASSGALVPTDT